MCFGMRFGQVKMYIFLESLNSEIEIMFNRVPFSALLIITNGISKRNGYLHGQGIYYGYFG